ncbi:MAG: hypothetical protein O6758_09580, partial [Planctomycetota bacterium]|nr:hypothetical protein [Planctomycetota bacterium]
MASIASANDTYPANRRGAGEPPRAQAALHFHAGLFGNITRKNIAGFFSRAQLVQRGFELILRGQPDKLLLDLA